VVANLLEGVLQRRQRDAVRGFAVAVLALGRLERVDVPVLRLPRRPGQGRRQPFAFLVRECHRDALPA
jgi:hypothetical protein